MSLPPILTTTEEVAALAAKLQQEQVIAVDLEADSMHNYQEKVCLLQFSTEAETVLIDPLAGAELDPLKAVLAEPQIRKIFHAADYDIRCLARDFDIEINGLFDTMISSQFLGEEKFGLADVLRKYFAVELDKQYQRADWSKRPLSEGMIRYAAEDTCHLHRLVEILEQKLIEKGRLDWVQEEFALLEKVRFAVHEGPLFLRFKGAGTLDRRQLAVLEALLQWRDAEAQRRDCPLYKVLGNKSLLHMAKLKPTGRNKLQEVEGLSPRLIDRYGGKLLHQIGTALELPESELPVYPRGERRQKDPQVEKRMSRLKDWRKQVAAELELDPGVLINNALLDELARKQPQAEADFAQIDQLKNWQRKVLGEGILRVLS
ncbi:ribonuclease D [Malonomonas rubra DSM 5091]|uniref:Ribonuclease D n=1 Tax=Malonomonas rubra DSM 5091 TaxID=1122189 RepID=A0A1M6HKZ0_MALRU|nr:HRDC domain-containing protein [Malonomonas rubra]SHJ22833.1 ribonuclease D [Malonomonas rubra DSM 5091]